MTDFDFLPSIPIGAAHTLERLTPRFQSIKDGLSDVIRKSKDHYGRLGIAHRKKGQFVVLADTERRMLAVFDFADGISEDLDGWQTWPSRAIRTCRRQ